MKYSVIICYRDREDHLKQLAPRLEQVFGKDAEIIVVEQDDKGKFLRGSLFNVGAQLAKGDILIFHDVDHYPVDVEYEPPEGVDMWLPIKRVTFTDNKLADLPTEEIPSGYRHFAEKVDDNFYGGVEVFRREAFYKINGFNSLYKGWGLEDADLRERVKHYGMNVQRGDGDFYALQHKDSNPGVEDEDFQQNQMMFDKWSDYLKAGVRTQIQSINRKTVYIQGVKIDWVKATNFQITTIEAMPLMSMEGMVDFYEDTPEKHVQIWRGFKALVNENPKLKSHREWVIANDWGYGNRSLHWMWFLVFKDLPTDFKFLEIGVFKGQVISLASLLNKHFKKNGQIYGITPLTNRGDKYSKHPNLDYSKSIRRIYQAFGLNMQEVAIIEGLSDDPDVIETAQWCGPFDVIFIDGCHDYKVVVSDIENYSKMLPIGGLLVIDDASNYLNIPDGLIRLDWRGLEDVSNAARDTIEKDDCFEHLFAVGHNRIWKKCAEKIDE